MNSLLTLSTHEIAKEIVNSTGNDGVCLILNELIREKLSYASHQGAVYLSTTPTVEILYDTPAATYNLYVDSGFRDYVHAPENTPSARFSLYYFKLFTSDPAEGVPCRFRLAVAKRLLAAPDRKIVIPTVTRLIYGINQITYLRF
jgi:hypothetical protein